MQYVVGIEEFVNAHVFDSEKVGGEEGCTIFTKDLVLNKAEYKENSELNTSDPIRYIHTKASIPETGDASDIKVGIAEFKID
ncbi:TPA: hypothetical protein ACQYDI_003705 [Vibrio parahaemolyticus]|nr:hypothetical protein [Vibrio parahaemolyticus]